MTTVRIAEIANVIRGVNYDKNDASDIPRKGYLPILRAGNIGDVLNTEDDFVWVPSSNVSAAQNIRAGDIAICMSSGSASVVGKTATARTDWLGSVGAFCSLIRADASRCLPEYLGFYLKSHSFRRWTSEAQGANIKNIRKSALEDFAVPLPLLAEQRRIVDILSRAEGIVRLRREAQKKAAEIIPALFLDMFGDPATNPKGWAFSKIGELFAVKGGKRLPKGTPYSDAPTKFRYIRGTDISPDYIKRDGLVFLPPDIQSTIARYVVSTGDVVITIAGKIGVAAPVGDDLSGVNLTENAAMLRPKSNVQTHPIFLSRMINSQFVQNQIETLTGRVTIGKLALERIRLLEILLPPMKHQVAFAEQVEKVRSIHYQQSAATAKAEATFDTLLAKAFSTHSIER